MTLFYSGFYPEDLESFRKEIDYLANNSAKCDAAFVILTGESDYPYINYIIEKLNPKFLFPDVNDRGNEFYLGELTNKIKANHPALQIYLPQNAGDCFHIQY